jgi:hypothetical protein
MGDFHIYRIPDGNYITTGETYTFTIDTTLFNSQNFSLTMAVEGQFNFGESFDSDYIKSIVAK